MYLDTHTHTRTHTHTLFQHANRSWILEGRNPPERQPLRVERAQEEVAEATQRAAEVCPALVASCVGWCWRKVTTQSTTGSKGVSSTCCFLRGLFAGEKSQRKTQRAAKVCQALVVSCVGCSLEKITLQKLPSRLLSRVFCEASCGCVVCQVEKTVSFTQRPHCVRVFVCVHVCVRV